MSYPHDKEYGDQKQFPVPVLDNTEIVQKNGTVWSRKQSSWKKRLNCLLIKTNNLLNKIHSETLALLCTALKLLCHELFQPHPATPAAALPYPLNFPGPRPNAHSQMRLSRWGSALRQ